MLTKKNFINASWLLSEKVLRTIAELIVGILVVRYLGPSDYGVLSYLQSIAIIFFVISALGLDEVVVRELVRNPFNTESYLNVTFYIRIFACVTIIIPIFICYMNDLGGEYLFLLFVMLLGLIFKSFDVVCFYYHANQISKYIFHASFFSISLSALIKIIAIYNNASLFILVVIYAFDSFISAFFLIIVFKKTYGLKVFRLGNYNGSIALQLLRKSFPLLIGGVAVTLYSKIDQIMIGNYLGYQELGIYSAATRLSEAWFSVGVIFSLSLFPAFINSKINSEQEYERNLVIIYSYMTISAYLITLFVAVFSESILNVLYGELFVSASNVLIIQFFSAVFVFLGAASRKWLLVEELEYLALVRVLSGLGLNLFLNFYLIPNYGINGAAISTLLSQFFAAYLVDFFNARTKRSFYMKTRALFNFVEVLNAKKNN